MTNLTDIQLNWIERYSETKEQYDKCQSVNEVSNLTAKLNRQAMDDLISTPMGAIKFFSQQRRDKLAQGHATTYDKHGLVASTTDSNGQKTARRFS
jgi:YD repeat-containing protein